MGASGAQNVVRGVHSSSAWNVAWDVLEDDELLGMTLGQRCHCEIRCAWGLNSKSQNIERNIARVIAGDVPESIVETLLVPVLLASVASTSVLSVALAQLQPLVGDIAGDVSWLIPAGRKIIKQSRS